MQQPGSDVATFPGRQSSGAQVFAGLPGGRLVVVSAVGFNEEKTRAMVSVRCDCKFVAPNLERQTPTATRVLS